MDLGLDYSDGDWDHLRKLLVEESINKNNVNNVNMVQVINNNMDNIVRNNMEDNTDSQTVKCASRLHFIVGFIGVNVNWCPKPKFSHETEFISIQ